MYHKAQIGWLDPLAQQTVTTSGTYTISPMEWAAGGVQSLRIPRGASGQYFYLEYRRPFGSYFDTFSLSDPVVNGVSIRLAPDTSVINLSYLIDTNPLTQTFNDAPLRAGQTFTDSVDGMTVSTTTVTAAGATVQVTLPGSTPPPPPPPPPADTIAPSAPGTLSGSVVSGPAVALAWGAASDNTGVVGYRVYRGITQIGTAGGTTYTDPSPIGGTTQSYTVRAYDAAGNLGPTGNNALRDDPLEHRHAAAPDPAAADVRRCARHAGRPGGQGHVGVRRHAYCLDRHVVGRGTDDLHVLVAALRPARLVRRHRRRNLRLVHAHLVGTWAAG